LCGTNVAESEDEFGPELEDRFVVRSVSRQVVDFFVRTGAVVLTFVWPEVSYASETQAAALHRDIGLRVLRPNK
jgi:hypothetical protein